MRSYEASSNGHWRSQNGEAVAEMSTESTIESAALRDALLPKLISGEIRVKDAERFLKERGV